MYRGVLLLLVVGFLMLIVIYLIKRLILKKLFTSRDIILSSVLIICFNLVFLTLVPVTIDRSISVFMLGYLSNNSQKVITKNDMTNYFVKKYVYENRAIEKRIDEQIFSGDISKCQNGYKITQRGNLLIKFYKIVADIFNIIKNLFLLNIS
jgi:energy-coupling factor transporter transmembrane protein EcfT